MRTIDADELKYTVSSGMCTDSITFSILLGMQNGNTNLDETTNKIVREHIKEVNRLIDNAPTVVNENLTAESPQGEWIPIKIRKLTEEEKEEYPDSTFMYDCPLPEDGEEVYITTFSGNTTLDTFYRDDGCYFENYCDAEDVIAWMPKPEPYKKGCAE